MKNIYATFAVLGAVGPYIFFARFLSAKGLDLSLFLDQLFASDISTFFVVDLLIATLVFWIFAAVESRRRSIRFWWICIPATLFIGLSFGLPLFLYLREGALERRTREILDDESTG
jgi:hypothetical protein